MTKKLLPYLLASVVFLSACATQQKTAGGKGGVAHAVRTTAYTQSEPGGSHDAMGHRLTCGKLNSAAADWSRFPLGTKFKILSTGEVFQVNDYGSALIGTNTIDLYKNSRVAMRQWGVRHVDIQILEWGSAEKSLQVLAPRAHNPKVRRMISGLQKNS